MSIEKKLFGKLNDGREVYSYTMTSQCGISVTVLDLGCAIYSIKVPDKDGILRDVVSNFDDVNELHVSGDYCGKIIGRYANRIGGGHFTLDGVTYELSKNNFQGKHTLHGGFNGIDKKIWNVEAGQCGCGADRIKFTCFSEDGEEGFPGNVSFKIVYRLAPDGEFAIRYMAQADKNTPLALTNHAFFNMEGYENTNVHDNELTVYANEYAAIDESLIPEGLEKVEGTIFDFRKPKKLGQDINCDNIQIKRAGGYDHAYVIDQNSEKITWKHDMILTKAASLYSQKTGIRMDLYTDAPAIQVYSGNFLGTGTFKGNIPSKKQGAMCLEPGYLPDTPNHPEYPSCIYGPDREYNSATVLKFSTESR